MKVICTHENTDFDGFAALVAAARLFPTALAVIPHRLNRNVHDFLTIYQEELPLHWPDDLPDERVETIILVDTQSPQQVRGMDKNTNYVIIDHHSMDRPLANATYELDTTGSVTTVLVERITTAGLPIRPLDATLYLMGIYEDTGNLAYSITTPRDLRAAAHLLEAGANLQVANRYLSYPLTDEQRQLYNLLVQNVEMVEFEAVVIAITTASAGRYVEEVSVLAHRLRDLYEPDALFLLVEMADHIQMVARGSNGSVNVGSVASHFGGGGHARAAAAIIRGLSLDEAKRRLIEYLPTVIEPTKTVRQIMSFGVHMLAPDTKVAEAAFLMQRYGHEGFPVVDGDRLVGIITRREIDRAMHHGLQRAPVRVYMRAENVSVSPQTGVREVQRLMTEHNIGQVPVVENGKVIGIVTRTDLIKLWAGEMEPMQPTNVAERLRDALPKPLAELIEAASQLAAQMGYNLYLVGGFVRDLLLGLPDLDLDLVVEGDAIALARALSDRYGGTVRSHRRFGTAKWLLGRFGLELAGKPLLPEHIDFASARTEFYERPSALPTVERSSIKQDLHRRDFTINTLAVYLNPERFGEVLDFFGGLKDLERGLIRVLHSLSFVEDPTRILRAVRLEARLGFRIEQRTADLINDARELLRRTSGERIAHELLLILEDEAPELALARLQELHVFAEISPSLHWSDRHQAAMRLVREVSPRWGLSRFDLPPVYLCLLAWNATQPEVEELIERLHLRRELRQYLRELPGLCAALPALASPALPPSQVYGLLRSYSKQALLAAYAWCDDGLAKERLWRFETEWRSLKPALGGEALRQLGLKPGPAYKHILESLRMARLDGEVSTREEEEHLLKDWLAEGRFREVLADTRA
ncbi:MAG: CBS domain-containing protein [Anaerolineae bacterium]